MGETGRQQMPQLGRDSGTERLWDGSCSGSEAVRTVRPTYPVP